MTLNMFLPAVQKATTPFRVEVITDGATLNMPIADGPEGAHQISIYFAGSPRGLKLFMIDGLTGETRSALAGTNGDALLVTVRILPATRGNGNQVAPLSAVLNPYEVLFTNSSDGTQSTSPHTRDLFPAP
jgi:hypothetical protein